MIWWLVRGRPRQFMVIWENSRCSILFHLLVPGARCPVASGSARSFAALVIEPRLHGRPGRGGHHRRRRSHLPAPSGKPGTLSEVRRLIIRHALTDQGRNAWL